MQRMRVELYMRRQQQHWPVVTLIRILRSCPSRHPVPPLQARSGCAARYLGADATACNNPRVSLYSFADMRALIKWRL